MTCVIDLDYDFTVPAHLTPILMLPLFPVSQEDPDCLQQLIDALASHVSSMRTTLRRKLAKTSSSYTNMLPRPASMAVEVGKGGEQNGGGGGDVGGGGGGGGGWGEWRQEVVRGQDFFH